MQIVELVINEDSEGVSAVSVVDKPAIEENFIALSKHEVELKEINPEKRILMGAALVPNKQIYRKVKDKEFYIFFSEETVRKASELFLKNGNQSNATEQHEKQIKGMTVVETWLVENPKNDKANHYGFDVPQGTWMLSVKVDNDDVWSKVKSGELKGFSIEGHFADKVEMSIQHDPNEELINKIKDLLKNV